MRTAILLVVLGSAGCGGLVEQESGRNTGGATGGATDSGSPSAETGSTDAAGPATCAPGAEGGGITGSACRPLTELQAEAELSCKGAGGVAEFTPRGTCADRYRYTEFTCCTADGACGDRQRDGSETSCKAEADWRMIASYRCGLDKKTLGAFSLVEPCQGSGYKGYSYSCCAR